MPVVTDMLGRTVEVPDKPQHIISLVPSQTELLYDLGLEDEVACITKFCVHPEGWFRNKIRIGGTKTVHIDKVAALNPDLIIANKEENTRSDIEALEQIAPVWVSDIHTLSEALEMISAVGKLCNKEQEAAAVISKIKDGFAQLPVSPEGATSLSIRQRPMMKRTAYCIWRNPWMWAGGDTFIDDMLSHCGLQNVFAETPRYPEAPPESLAGSGVELVLLSSEPYPFKEVHIAEIKAALPGVEVRLVDGEMFSWYGSRLIHAPEYFASLLRAL